MSSTPKKHRGRKSLQETLSAHFGITKQREFFAKLNEELQGISTSTKAVEHLEKTTGVKHSIAAFRAMANTGMSKSLFTKASPMGLIANAKRGRRKVEVPETPAVETPAVAAPESTEEAA